MYEIALLTQQLISFSEIQAVCFSLFIAMVGMGLFVGVIILLHTWYRINGYSRLYKKREPVKNWDRQFYPIAFLLIVFIYAAGWVLYQFSQGIVPFTS